MAEYIEREAVIDELDEWKELYKDSGAACDVLVLAKRAIRKLPAADVRPVVLCRDCKRYGGRSWENNETGICARTDCGVGEDDFCSYGEKREES